DSSKETSNVSSFRKVASAFGALLVTALSARASLDPSKALTQYVHRSWQADSGLPQNSVLAIAQTPDGYLWLGTEGGLVRFDGVRFSPIDDPALKIERVRQLYVDRSSRLWVVGEQGDVALIHEGRVKAFAAADGVRAGGLQT